MSLLSSLSALTPRMRAQRDPRPVADLQLREVAGHLTFTGSTVTAWYTLPERMWAFRPDADREAFLVSVADQYAGLAGCRLHLRRTTRPYPVGRWAANLLRGSHPVGDAEAFAAHIRSAATHLDADDPHEGQVFLGVSVARRRLGDVTGEWLRAKANRGGTARTERERLDAAIAKHTSALAPWGLGAEPATPTELGWLLYRSVGLGLTPPDRRATSLGAEDIVALTEHIDRYRTPYGSTVRLVNRLTEEECHVAVLTVGRMEPLEIPQKHQPWLHLADEMPWPVETSSRVDVLGPAGSAASLERRLRMIRSQQGDYADHTMDSPPELERLAKRALEVGDEIGTGLPVDSSRVHGWHRLAVAGATSKECLERAEELKRLYYQRARAILQHPKHQDRLAREFVPGEPVGDTMHLRRMPVKLFAAAVPQAAAAVGDGRGDLIGHTTGTGHRPVMFDPHFPMEVRERSGLAVFVAEPGGGKSTLMGALGYLAARRGVQVTLLDPSGPLAKLAKMPALRGHSRVVNLAGAEYGTLAPYALIPTPVRQDFAKGTTGQREFEIAIDSARYERLAVVHDICTMLLPPAVARKEDTPTVLGEALRQVPKEETSTLEDVIQRLLDAGDVPSKNLANLLIDKSEMPLARLFFGSPPPGLLSVDAALTVITMGGLRLPDLSVDRQDWSLEESLAVPMLHTAHLLAVRRCYGGDMRRRKLVGLDEAHFMQGWASGRSFLVRLARDSRKWNIAALVASQNPKDILGLDVQNLVSTVFVGRVAGNAAVAADALEMLQVPANSGYEQVLAGLSQNDPTSTDRLGYREFVMRDVEGRVQKIRVDLSYADGLLEHLDTTPGDPR